MRTLILFLLAALLAISADAKADEALLNHLQGKTVVYQGSCQFDAKGNLTFKQENMKTVEPCVVGMELPDESRHYILLFEGRKPKKLILYNEKDKTQKTLWVSGSL